MIILFETCILLLFDLLCYFNVAIYFLYRETIFRFFARVKDRPRSTMGKVQKNNAQVVYV